MMLIPDVPVLSSDAVECFGSFRLHSDGTLFQDGRQIHLSPKELAALRVLLRHAGRIVTPGELQEELWGDVHVTGDSVPRCISALRTRLGAEGSIQTVYKQGYRLLLPVTVESASATSAPRLAIMPFSLEPGVPEHLGRAVAEEVTAQLTLLQPRMFQILARDSVFMLAGQGMSAQQTGEALKADFVLTGTVRLFAVDFRLRTEMIRVEGGTQMWVEDLLANRESIGSLADRIVNQLAFHTGYALPERGEEGHPAANPEAYDLFLRARHDWQSLDPHRMQEGVRSLQRAGELDPQLSNIPLEIVRATVARELFGYLEPSAAAEQVRHIARALENSPDGLGAIAPALAWFAFHVDRDASAMLSWLEKSNAATVDGWSLGIEALLAASRHRFAEAAGMLERALYTDPYSPWLGASLAWMYHLADDGPRSLRQLENCIQIAPDHTATLFYGGMILAFRDDPKRAAALTSELMARAPAFDMSLAMHAYALARNGEREQAEELLERLQWMSRERYVVRSFSAAAYLALGDPDSAIAELEASNAVRCPWLLQMLGDPRLRPLHERADFRQLLEIVAGADAALSGDAVGQQEIAATAK